MSQEETVSALELPVPEDEPYEASIARTEDLQDGSDPLLELFEQDEPTSPVPGTGGGGVGGIPHEPKTTGSTTKSKRHRSITDLRIAVHGKTPGCGGCSEGTYSHTPECRKRFNDILDSQEPSRTRKKMEGDKDFMALTSPITGQELREQTLEQGTDAVAAIYLQAIEEGHGDEKLLAEKLGMVMQEASRPKRVKTQNKRKWFVEYCCSENGACCRVLTCTKDFRTWFLV